VLQPIITTKAVTEMADLAANVHTDTAVLEYVSRLAEETRNAHEVRVGVSVRGALALVRCAKVWAAAHGRNYVLPDDIKELAQPVWCHRFVLDPEAEFAGSRPEAVLSRIMADVAAPQERASA
jgi:MoxR-like ATPase